MFLSSGINCRFKEQNADLYFLAALGGGGDGGGGEGVGYPGKSCVTHKVVDLSRSIATFIKPESVRTKKLSPPVFLWPLCCY